MSVQTVFLVTALAKMPLHYYHYDGDDDDDRNLFQSTPHKCILLSKIIFFKNASTFEMIVQSHLL